MEAFWGPFGAWLAPLAGFAGTVGLLAAFLLRDHVRLERRAAGLEGRVEALQDELWEASERAETYRAIVEAQLDLIVQRDSQGLITFANEGYAALIGRPRPALIGTAATLRTAEAVAVGQRDDGARLVDEAVETPEGLRWIAWIEATVEGRSGHPETLRAGRDVTARVVTERALEDARIRAEAASEAKSRFLATVSHEFRTPLNGILGMTDLVLDTDLTPEQATYVRAVKTSGEALLSLIDEILDFSKIEAGKLDLVAEAFDLHALVEGVVELLAPRAQGKGIEIAAFVAPGTPRRVVGDGDRLRQVLVNLAGNAVKFTDVGGVGLQVDRVPGGAIQIAVMDTGPGLAAERIPSLFEEFEQGDASPSRRHGGTGLGLAITRRIVERMQGGIAVTSELGRGTSFQVTLPLPPAEEEAAAPAPALPLKGRRILVVARSPFEAPFVAQRLVEAGAEVAHVEHVVDAVAKLATAPFDTLIADCALGDTTVREIAAEARRSGVAHSLVLLSPFERRDFGSPHASGFSGYLVKPVRPRSLLDRLSEPATAHLLRADDRPRRPAPARAGAVRVLLAEDNEINALLAIRSLEKLGAIVDWAKDGQEVLNLAEVSFAGLRPPYDLVLMDVRMPGIDGHEATRRIRMIEQALGRRERARIVALTANARREDEAAAREAGADGFLAKPFDPSALRALLQPDAAALAAAS